MVGFCLWIIYVLFASILCVFLSCAMFMKIAQQRFRKMSCFCGLFLPVLSFYFAIALLISFRFYSPYDYPDGDVHCVPGAGSILSFLSIIFWVFAFVIMRRYLSSEPHTADTSQQDKVGIDSELIETNSAVLGQSIPEEGQPEVVSMQCIDATPTTE